MGSVTTFERRRKVVESLLERHTDWSSPCKDIGVATEAQIKHAEEKGGGSDGVSIGDTAIVCDVTGIVIVSQSIFFRVRHLCLFCMLLPELRCFCSTKSLRA